MSKNQNSLFLPIGTTLYAVAKQYIDENIGGKIMVCKIKTYENYKKKVIPILQVVGSKEELSKTAFYHYKVLDEAIEAITIK